MTNTDNIKVKTKICAIYTRKSTDERLDMEFNTLDAQREACEAYILSQRSEGWLTSPSEYDDGGFSGGNLNRPALNRLMDDIKNRRVHIVVVYKIDRLTRSLMDFSKLVEVFDEYGVTFVSITQSFNTTTSMGRLTLNVLLSFAQFEREVTSERIRDKIAASKKRGMWVGGAAPMGYQIENRRLVINEVEAKTARMIFSLYLKLGTVRALKHELDKKEIVSPERISKKGKHSGGKAFSRGALHSILKNPAYNGKIQHKENIYDGLHAAIIETDMWDAVQTKLKKQATEIKLRTEKKYVLQGLLFDPDNVIYSPTYTKKPNGIENRYYISQNLLQYRDHPRRQVARIPAYEMEKLIDRSLRSALPKIYPVDSGGGLRDHLLQKHNGISMHDFIRDLVSKICVEVGQVTIELKPDGLEVLAKKHLSLIIQNSDLDLRDIRVPYQTRKMRHGTTVIEPTSNVQKDPLDMPQADLEKLVQGLIWRDEHFDGTTLKDIAKREKCSEAYVGTAIYKGFDVLISSS